MRYLDIVNLNSSVHNQNLIPLVSVGYWLDLGPLLIDFRLSQTSYIVSWSSMAGAHPAAGFYFSPMTGISPWMPLLMVSVGYRF